MHILPILLLVATASPSRVAVNDAVHTRLSRIIQQTIVDELHSRSITTADDAEFTAEIVDASDASGKGRTSQIQADMTHSVQVTEVTGGAAAEVRLYDRTHVLLATYRLSGSGSSSAAVGSRTGDVITSLVIAPFLRRSRSAEAARAIGHDIAASIASAVSEQTAH